MSGSVSVNHLSRKAYIYVRQSSVSQVAHHKESRQVQYNLIHRAQALGWSVSRVEVIDQDLGLSASGSRQRKGFQELLKAICSGAVGGLFFLYASRLARNNWEWHQALEVCSLFDTLIIDRERIYDPSLPSDRLLLGMQGSFSEYEVKQMHIRSQEAQWNKAARGELFRLLPAGLVRDDDGCIRVDADERIRHAIKMVFTRFEQLGSIRQVYHSLLQEELSLPVLEAKAGPARIVWRQPVYSTVHRILTNSLYAGIYQYPKTRTVYRIDDEGHLIKSGGHRLCSEDKVILIEGLFEGYISKEQFRENQARIMANANMKGQMAKGAPRKGASLLAGLLHCCQCGRKFRVRYSSSGQASYYCAGVTGVSPRGKCLSFSGRSLEAYVREQMVTVLQPQAIRAALIAEEQLKDQQQQKLQAISYELQQAEYEAGRIERQLNSVEPENQLVFNTLAHRWERALEKVESLKGRYDQALSSQKTLSTLQRQRLFELAADLEKLWAHPDCDGALKRQLVRILIREIWIAKSDDHHLKATIYWQGGVHTQFCFARTKRSAIGENVKEQRSLKQIITELAIVCDDIHIARILNRLGYPAPDGGTFTEPKISIYRSAHRIKPFSVAEYQRRNIINLKEAASMLGLNAGTVRRLIQREVLRAKQVIKYAPWQIHRPDLDQPAVRKVVQNIKEQKNSVSQAN